MVESPDFNDPALGIPVFSLYGRGRKPTDESLKTFDVLLVDLQDLGCRIYTFITTLRTCWRPPPRLASRSGCSTGPTPPAARWRG